MELCKTNSLGGADKQSKEPAENHDDHEGGVGRIADGAGSAVVVEAERDQRANTATQVEDDPENGNGASLLGLVDVGGHDGTLYNPDEGGSHTKNGSGGNNKGAVVVMVEMEQTAAVQSISPAADEEADARSGERKDRANEQKGSGGCGRQEGDGGVGGDGRVNLSRASDTCESVVHL